MKKKLVASLAAAMVLGVAGTSFAASNPFVDVPANNWAYGSVTKLAQAGIIDGYGDGTFRGDKTITRYEMAQIVAKAIANEDKANAEQKAEIKKLQAEYADELDKLGVRLSKVEAKQSNLKFTGDLRVRWNNLEDRPNGQQFKDRFRLNMTSQINDTTSLYARFVFQDDAFNQDNGQRLSDMALTTKGLLPNTDVTLGRYTLNLGPTTSVAGTTGDMDGIMTNTKVGNFGLMGGYAQARNTGVASLVRNNLFIKNIVFAEGTYQLGKAKINADYFKNLNAGKNAGDAVSAPYVPVTAHNIVDAYQIAGGGITYTFDSNVKLSGEYYQNSAGGAKMADGSSPSATIARLSYKGASAAKPKSFGMYLEYNKFEGDSLPYAFEGPFTKNYYGDVGLSTTDRHGLKSYVAQVDYTLAKNVVLNADYQFNIKDAVTGDDAPAKSFSRVQVNYFF
jgi:hypothetical protein